MGGVTGELRRKTLSYMTMGALMAFGWGMLGVMSLLQWTLGGARIELPDHASSPPPAPEGEPAT